MLNIFNNVKDQVTNLAQAIAGIIAGPGADVDRKVAAELAVIGVESEVPAWLTEIHTDPVKALAAAGITKLKPVVQGGHFEGTNEIVLLKFWGSPVGGAPKSGDTVWASTEAGKVFGYFRAWARKEGKADPGVLIQHLNPETGEPDGPFLEVPDRDPETGAEVRSWKFKPTGGNDYEAAITAIEAYLVLNGDGKRKDWVLLAECGGKHYAETGGEAKLPTGHVIQPIKGWVLFEIPKPKELAADSRRGLVPARSRHISLTQVGDAAANPATEPRRTEPVNAFDALGIVAAADQL